MLPCPSCAIHYRAYFEKTFSDAVTESGTALSRWIYDMHEHVNSRFQIESGVKFEDVRALVNKFPTRYIDLDTGDILMQPRYTDAFGVSAPHEKEARAWLEANPTKALSDRPFIAQLFDPIGEKQLAFVTRVAFAALIVVALTLLGTTLYYALRYTNNEKRDSLPRSDNEETDQDAVLGQETLLKEVN